MTAHSSSSGERRALSYAAALESIVSAMQPLGAVTIPLADAHGSAFAEDVVSTLTMPPFDNAGMDGYAARREDVVAARADTPAILREVAIIAAGDSAERTSVGPGECVRIMTGAPVPRGATCVVRVEDTTRDGSGIQVMSSRDAGMRANIRPRGEEFQQGDVLFRQGESISAGHIGVLASIGAAQVAVHRRPRVCIVSSGDELVTVDRFHEIDQDVHRGAKVVSSTTYALPALLRLAGADVRTAPITRDTLRDVTDAIGSALSGGCDLLITTGGVSVGEHDYTRDALRALGGTIEFWRARIRPGGPLGTGNVSGVPWLGLPGNPVSSMVTALLFAWPSLRRLAGHRYVHHRKLRVRMMGRATVAAPLTHFLRIRVEPSATHVLEAHLAGPQGSNLLQTYARADALAIVPEHIDVVEEGMELDAIMIPDGAGAYSPAVSVTANDVLDTHA